MCCILMPQMSKVKHFWQLYIMLGRLMYSDATYYAGSTYVCSVAVLWEPCVSKKLFFNEPCFFAVWKCIFQPIQEGFK